MSHSCLVDDSQRCVQDFSFAHRLFDIRAKCCHVTSCRCTLRLQARRDGSNRCILILTHSVKLGIRFLLQARKVLLSLGAKLRDVTRQIILKRLKSRSRVSTHTTHLSFDPFVQRCQCVCQFSRLHKLCIVDRTIIVTVCQRHEAV